LSKRGNDSVQTAISKVQNRSPVIFAGQDTLPAENAFIAVEYDQRVAGVNGIFQRDSVETPVVEFEMLMGGYVLQLALFILCASCAVQRMIAQQQVERCFA